jgi:hypothetical protein
VVPGIINGHGHPDDFIATLKERNVGGKKFE